MEEFNNLAKLVAFKTDGNKVEINRLIDFYSNFLRENGFETTVIKAKGKSNLIGIFRNGDMNKSIVLSGHIDTVKTNVSLWKSDPFKLVEKENFLFGLGVCDMKFFFSFIMDNIGELKQINRSIIIVLTSDEETSVRGIKKVIDFIKLNNIHPKYAILGEPTENKICLSSKGCYEFLTTFFGKACHSSNPANGINAISAMAKFITFLENLNNDLNKDEASINVGKIGGGKSCNIVADKCFINWDLRINSLELYQEIIDKIDKKINEISNKYGLINLKNTNTLCIPPFKNDTSKLYNFIKNNFNIEKISFNGGTEAGYFQMNNIDTIIFGASSMNEAHSINEFIKKDEYDNYCKNLLLIMKSLN